MAGSARYTAVLDACVLYPAPLRDVLLSLGRAGLYHAKWTSQIHDEWVRSLQAQRPDIAEDKLRRTREMMNSSIPDCLIENYEALTDTIQLPDAGDRHVVAAAIIGHADAIITFNLKDFPASALSSYNIEAQHPDDFIVNQLELHELAALTAIKEMRARLIKPVQSAAELIATFERNQLTQTAAWLKRAEKLI